MKVLRVHNAYREPGGEDTVHALETRLLRDAGCEVVLYERSSREIEAYGVGRRATLPLRSAFAWDTRRELRALLARERPDVAHFTNPFPLISPAAYAVCRESGVPVVQSLHNYRLLCPAATLLRAGRVCEDCISHSLLESVRHGCYRGSRAASATVAAGLAAHRAFGTFERQVDLYVALTEFARGVFARGGLPAERIAVKPNFVTPDPGAREGDGDLLLFAGRLAPEKGVATLLAAGQRLGPRVPLWLAGDGPLRRELETAAADLGVPARFLGALPRDELLKTLGRARLLVVPSEWYEGFPMVIAEAFARGVPVLASRLGGMAEIVEEGVSGLLFEPGDPGSLAERIGGIWDRPERLRALGRGARRAFEERFAAPRQRELLLGIYRRAARHFAQRAGL